MSRLHSPILADFGDSIGFHCPGCGYPHVVRVVPAAGSPAWGFNGNYTTPTFTPSVLMQTGRAVNPTFQPEPGDPPEVCHSFVTDGCIQFLGDCTDDLAGQTVDLPEWPK